MDDVIIVLLARNPGVQAEEVSESRRRPRKPSALHLHGLSHTDHTDANAAITIERRSNTSLLDVEGGIGSPMKRQLDETSRSP